ncbi:phosphatase PAP2 family protein [Dysgonomonadaceae bacterium zrk40]|nr:phosphatase PAP2 family protein [Dysgonomonadaceae bacterium zrk40]
MKEAIENLIPLERDLFFLLNGSDSSFLDDWMWTVSGRFVWIPLFLAILFLFFYRTPRKQALLVTLFFILVFVLSDQLSSGFCKPFFERFRPTHHPDFKELVDIVNGYRGGRYGFISGHATNSFGLAVFLSLLFRHRGVTLAALSWALLNSYTRIYLGVHFISDIVAGMLAGSLLAFLLYRLMMLLLSRLPATQDLSAGTLYNRKQGNWLAMFILAYIFLLTLFSPLMASLPH